MTQKEILLYIRQLLNDNKITWVYETGNLLKAVRDNYLDPEDDIDIGVMEHDMDKVKKLILSNAKLRPFLKVKKEWATELSTKINGFQFDFFTINYDAKFLYHYYYDKNPNDNNQWTLKYRIRFPKEVYFPLNTYKFLGVDFPVPNNINKRLEIQYGDWKTPVKAFFGRHNILNVDKSYLVDEKDFVPLYSSDLFQKKLSTDIAVMFSTFMRDDMCQQTIQFFRKFPYRLYITDQGFFSLEKEEYYKQLRKEGHVIIYLPFDCGLSYARNKLVKLIKEPYIFLCDDDIRIQNNLEKHLEIFKKDKTVGVVGGQLNNHQTNRRQLYSHKLELNDGVLNYFPVKYGYCDVVLNFALFRKEVFNTILWDEEQKIVEHTDFYLRLKNQDKWKVYFETNLIGDHYPERKDEYITFRKRPEFNARFMNKWGIKEIKGV